MPTEYGLDRQGRPYRRDVSYRYTAEDLGEFGTASICAFEIGEKDGFGGKNQKSSEGSIASCGREVIAEASVDRLTPEEREKRRVFEEAKATLPFLRNVPEHWLQQLLESHGIDGLRVMGRRRGIRVY